MKTLVTAIGLAALSACATGPTVKFNGREAPEESSGWPAWIVGGTVAGLVVYGIAASAGDDHESTGVRPDVVSEPETN